MPGQDPQDAYLLAELGSTVKVLVEELDSGKMDSEHFIREVREAVQRAGLIAGPPRPRD